MVDRFSPEAKQKDRLALQMLQQQIATGSAAEQRAQQAHEAAQTRSATRDPLELAMLRETGEAAKFGRETAQAEAPYKLGAAKTAQELVQEQLLGEREMRPQRLLESQMKTNLGAVQSATEAQKAAADVAKAGAIATGATEDAATNKRLARLKELEFMRAAMPRGAGGQPATLNPKYVEDIVPGAFKSPLDPSLVGQAVQDFYTGGDQRAQAIERILKDPDLKTGVLQMDPSIGDVLAKGVQAAPGQGPLAPPFVGPPAPQPRAQLPSPMGEPPPLTDWQGLVAAKNAVMPAVRTGLEWLGQQRPGGEVERAYLENLRRQREAQQRR